MNSTPVTPCCESSATDSGDTGVARVDVDDDLHAAGVARIDVHGHHATHVDAQVAHRCAPGQAADAAVEIDFVAGEVAVLARIGVPVDEQAGHGDDQQHEGADGRIVCFTLHLASPARAL